MGRKLIEFWRYASTPDGEFTIMAILGLVFGFSCICLGASSLVIGPRPLIK